MRRLSALIVLLALGVGQPLHAAARLGLSGRLAGVVHDQPAIPDVPVTHEVSGRGTTNLGPTTVAGSFAGTGNIARGQCSGTLTLSSDRGTLTLKLSSVKIASFSECPVPLAWRITQGTGALVGTQGSGTMHLSRRAARFTLVFDGPATAPPPLPSTGPNGNLAALGLVLLLTATAGWRVIRTASPFLRAGQTRP
jgi:hypothetical protein